MTGRQSSFQFGKATTSTRSSAANAAALPTEAMNAVTGVGAPWYTSGVHMWNGHRGDLEAEADEQQRDAGEHQRVVALDRHAG